MTWKNAAAIAAVTCGVTATAAAQIRPTPTIVTWSAGEAGPEAGLFAAEADGQQGAISVVALDPLTVGRTVPNAPYSAEAITEITQTLADGNRIEQRTSALVARDSAGRTRREQRGIAVGALMAQSDQPIVTITDPTTGTHVTLNYAEKIALRAKPLRVERAGGEHQPGGNVAFHRYAGGPPLQPGAPAPLPPPAFVVDAPGDMPAGTPMGSPAPPLTATLAATRFEGDVKTESLEPRTIEGIHAEGTRTTMTIPAGTVGNVLPIEIVSERWYSPELDVVLMTRRSDPRFGETIYRLTNIVRAEPSPDLFTVPSDFKIEDVRPGRTFRKRPGGD